MEFTGERMVPENAPPDVFWEHIYRYRFAAKYVRNKRILDIACGEGYGTAALLEAGATSVVGVDICEETCNHARSKYGIDVRLGCAEAIPLPNRSIDVIVSFETIEHVERPEAFLKECGRVLVPGGKLIMSTPNKDAYGEVGSDNPFHVRELTETELISLLRPHFKSWQLYTQRPLSAAWWSLRSFAAISSPWLHLRGYCRLMDLVRIATCPNIRGPVDDNSRLSTSQVIMTKEKPLASLVNQYSIWRLSQRRRELPQYFVAVAELY